LPRRQDEVTYTVQPILSKAPPKPKTEAPKPKAEEAPKQEEMDIDE